jgi:GxxExxY protein
MTQTEKSFPHEEITSAILSGSFDVSNELGHGFSEKVNRSALALVLRQKGLTAVEEQILRVIFRNQVIGTFFADLVVEGLVLVELKAAVAIEPWMDAQLLNLLKAAGGGVGMLLNFGRRVDYRRRISGDNPRDSLPVLRQGCPQARTDGSERG